MKTSTLVLVGGAAAVGVYYLVKRAQPAPAQSPLGSALQGLVTAVKGLASSSPTPTPSPLAGTPLGGTIVDPTAWGSANAQPNVYRPNRGGTLPSGYARNLNFPPASSTPFTQRQAAQGGVINYSSYAFPH